MCTDYDLWLCNLPGVGNVRGRELLLLCGGSAKELYHAPDSLWRQVLTQKQYDKVKEFTEGWKLQEEAEKLAEKNIGVVTLAGAAYPGRLKQIPDPPLGLYYKGRLPGEEPLAVAVIGARDCSPYGTYVAGELGRALGKLGIPIISGMAKGIDGISQKSALEAEGSSFGVLGCGVDICYPAANKKLYDRLLAQGGILSAFPPGTLPRAGNFPPRNRIVSGLSDVLVVIEARNKSGTLITVDMALEQGREVYVVPGRVTDRLSDGCNKLLKQGAQVFLSPQEFVEEVRGLMTDAWRHQQKKPPEGEAEKKEQEKGASPLEGNFGEKAGGRLETVCETLDFTPQTLAQIQEKLPFSCTVSELGGMLMKLCIQKRAAQPGPGYFYKI